MLATLVSLAISIAVQRGEPPYLFEPFTLAGVKGFVAKGVSIKESRGPAFEWYCRAVYQHKADIVEYLLEHGRTANKPLRGGDNALRFNSEQSWYKKGDILETARVLLRHGAKIDAPGPYDKDTPLAAACLQGNAELARLLLKAGANPNIANVRGETPLYLAMVTTHYPHFYSVRPSAIPKTIATLISYGADVLQPLFERHTTALHIMVYDGYVEGLKLAIRRGTNVNARMGDGKTPLHVAALGDDRAEIIQILLRAGAKKAMRDNNGQTPFDIAISKGFRHTPSLLKP